MGKGSDAENERDRRRSQTRWADIFEGRRVSWAGVEGRVACRSDRDDGREVHGYPLGGGRCYVREGPTVRAAIVFRQALDVDARRRGRGLIALLRRPAVVR